MRLCLLALSSVAFLLSGCTATLDSRSLRADLPREGFGYVLPFTQWTITSTWRLDYCPDPKNPTLNDGKDATLALKVEAVAGSEDDGDLAFIINPQDLQTLTSVTTFGAKWHDGRNVLSSINASVEDRTAQVIGNVVKTAVKIFSLTGLPTAPGAPPAAPGAAPSATVFCQDGAVTALAAAETAKATLQIRQGTLKKANAALAAISKKVEAMGDAVDDPTKSALAAAFDAVVKAAEDQAAAEEALTDAIKDISFTRNVKWPQEGDVFSGGPVRLDPAKLAAWLKLDQAKLKALLATGAVPEMIFFQVERTGNFGRVPDRLDMRPSAKGTVLPIDPSNPTLANSGAVPYQLPSTSSRGLRYRMPAKGLLAVCSRSPCSSEDVKGKIATFEGPVAQLGYVNVLPFRTRAFGSNAFSAEMNIDGSLKSVGYEQKAAPAEVATGAIADATAQITAVLDPTARLKAGNEYLKALKERRDALEALKAPEDDPVADETSTLNAETALLNARLERLRAEIALEELRMERGQ